MERITLTIDNQEISVNWQDNSSVQALSQQDIKISLSSYGDFEQVGNLGLSLPNEDRQQTAVAGDIMLYNSNNLVIFYGENTWSYTKLGQIDKSIDLTSLLAKDQLTVTLAIDK